MLKQAPSRIFKASPARLEKTPICTRLHAMPASEENHEAGFGQLRFANCETIIAGGSIHLMYREQGVVVLIPLYGSLSMYDKSGALETVAPESVKVFRAEKDSFYKVDNRLPQDISYLHIGFALPHEEMSKRAITHPIEFSSRNVLAPLHLGQLISSRYYGGVGVFDGRAETTYTLKRGGNGIFIYVINGAFEVEGRLLEQQDAIGFWDTPEIELEALAGNAILLLLEFPMSNQ